MYRLFVLLYLTASNSLLAETAANHENQTQYLQEARAHTQVFGKQLKQVLKSSIKQHGFEQAISACNLQAPAIEKSLNQNPWQVRRTSLQPRNPDNAADDWEKDKLRKFEQQLAQGKTLDSLEVMEINDGSVRYMKAISTEKLCLGCHGVALTNKVKQRLQSLYPTDQATGYKIGQLRGAFSLQLEKHQ